jgi:ribosomal protein S12 methylthiotransferase accessory factor
MFDQPIHEITVVRDEQYATRTVDAVPGFNYVPVPFDPARAIEWTLLVSLASGQTRWVATAHCFFNYRDPDDRSETFQLADSNGCAAGNTVEEAVLQGLLELVERDAVAIWWYTRAVRAEVDLASFADPSFSRLMDAYDQRGRELHVLDLTVDTGVPHINDASSTISSNSFSVSVSRIAYSFNAMRRCNSFDGSGAVMYRI